VGRLTFLERLEPAAQQLEDLDTARLVFRIQAGARQEFAALYMRYFQRVYSYMLIALRDRDLAEDATQEVFVKVMRALPRYERREAPFRTWLFVIVRNQALSELRRAARVKPIAPLELRRHQDAGSQEELSSHVLDWLTDRDLAMFIERLPLPQREVLMLRFLLDLSVRDTARILGHTPENVRALQHRALAYLRQRLTALGRRQTRESGPAPMRRTHRFAPVLRSRRFALTD
jgi:RNA polymerase sigma-70 factor (ECF subfamily)